MNPGVTSMPAASIVSRAASGASPTATMTPSLIATSARRAAAPVPSTTLPPRITKSYIGLSQLRPAPSGGIIA